MIISLNGYSITFDSSIIASSCWFCADGGVKIGNGGGSEKLFSSIAQLQDNGMTNHRSKHGYTYILVGLWISACSLFMIVVGLPRLSRCVAERICCSVFDDRRGGVLLVNGWTDRWLFTAPLTRRRFCWRFDVVGESSRTNPILYCYRTRQANFIDENAINVLSTVLELNKELPKVRCRSKCHVNIEKSSLFINRIIQR